MAYRLLPAVMILIGGVACAEDATTGPLVGNHHAEPTTAGFGDFGTAHSWVMPALSVEGKISEVREAQRIGSYGQPRWAALVTISTQSRSGAPGASGTATTRAGRRCCTGRLV